MFIDFWGECDIIKVKGYYLEIYDFFRYKEVTYVESRFFQSRYDTPAWLTPCRVLSG